MQAKLQGYITKNAVVVVSGTYCPYCTKAKRLLSGLTQDMGVYEIDRLPDGEELQQTIERTTGQDTIPAIWIRGQFVGGCSDVEALHKQGKLVPMIAGPAPAAGSS